MDPGGAQQTADAQGGGKRKRPKRECPRDVLWKFTHQCGNIEESQGQAGQIVGKKDPSRERSWNSSRKTNNGIERLGLLLGGPRLILSASAAAGLASKKTWAR